jgi:hypothetical protein
LQKGSWRCEQHFESRGSVLRVPFGTGHAFLGTRSLIAEHSASSL